MGNAPATPLALTIVFAQEKKKKEHVRVEDLPRQQTDIARTARTEQNKRTTIINHAKSLSLLVQHAK